MVNYGSASVYKFSNASVFLSAEHAGAAWLNRVGRSRVGPTILKRCDPALGEEVHALIAACSSGRPRAALTKHWLIHATMEPAVCSWKYIPWSWELG